MGIRVVVSFPWQKIEAYKVEVTTGIEIKSSLLNAVTFNKLSKKTRTVTKTRTVATTEYAEFDFVNERSVESVSKIATHPLMSGEPFSDHMYREPIKYTISGKYSLNGRNGDQIPIFHKGDNGNERINPGASITCTDKLGKIQEIFEKIKDEGILCNILTFEYEGENPTYDTDNVSTRFKVRKNMALEKITWKEKVNTMDFTFTFLEIITVESQEDIDTIEVFDGINIVNPVTKSFSAMLKDDGYRKAMASFLVDELYNLGYVDSSFIEKYANETGLEYTSSAYYEEMSDLEKQIEELKDRDKYYAATSAGLSRFSAVGALGTSALRLVVAGKIKKLTNKKAEEEANAAKGRVFTVDNFYASKEKLDNYVSSILNYVSKIQSNVSIYQLNVSEEEASSMSNLNVLMSVGDTYFLAQFSYTKTSGWKVAFYTVDDFTSAGINDGAIPASSTNLKVVKGGDLFSTTGEYILKYSNYQVYCVDYNLNNKNTASENVYTSLNNYSFWVCDGSLKQVFDSLEEAIKELIDNENWEAMR